MTNYFKMSIGAIFATNDNYSPAVDKTNLDDYTASTPNYFIHQNATATVAGVTLGFAELTGKTTDHVIIKNKSATISVTAGWTSASVAKTQAVGPGKFFVIPDITLASGLSLATASSTAECEVVVVAA
jgi:hypothetical protein